MKTYRRNPETFTLQGGSTGVLLIHGFTGSTGELRPLGAFLQEKGYTVHAPLLKGHGTTPEDMAKTSWADWRGSVREGIHVLRNKNCRNVFAAGLSMGGVLALEYSLEEELNGVLSLCTPIHVWDSRIHLCRYLKYVKQYKKNREEQEEHIRKHLYSYDRTPVRCIEELHKGIRRMKRRLPEVDTPLMIAQGERDETVRPESARYIHRHAGSTDKEIHWYDKSKHIITLDRQRQSLFADIHRFIDRVKTESE